MGGWRGEGGRTVWGVGGISGFSYIVLFLVVLAGGFVVVCLFGVRLRIVVVVGWVDCMEISSSLEE